MATNSMAISHGAGEKLAPGCGDRFGRFFYTLIFLMAGSNHFSAKTIAFRLLKGVPLASIAFRFLVWLAIAGGLSILLGYRAKLGAWLIVVFLIPVT